MDELIYKEEMNEEFDTCCIEDSVDVESWVNNKGSVEDLVPHITSGVSLNRCPREGQRTLWRVSDVFVHVAGILAIGSLLIQLSQKGLAAGEKESVASNKGVGRKGHT